MSMLMAVDTITHTCAVPILSATLSVGGTDNVTPMLHV